MINQSICGMPVALQHQILTRAAFSVASLFLTGILTFLFSAAVAVPFLLAAILLAISAGYIYWAAVNQRVLELKGVVLKVEQTAFHGRPKALLLEIQGKALRIVLHNRHHAPKAGDQIVLYILDSAQLYPWHGLHQLDNYLALVKDNTAPKA